MKVICVSPQSQLEAVAEGLHCLSPQIALGKNAVFAEIEASRQLFDPATCLHKAQALLDHLDIRGKISLAEDPATALAKIFQGEKRKEEFSLQALSFYLNPFDPPPFKAAEILPSLGVYTIGQFLALPRQEIASRLGKEGSLAYHRVLNAAHLAWPRFEPQEKIFEREDFGSSLDSLEPLFFLLKRILDRCFCRLLSRGKSLLSFSLIFHLHHFSPVRERKIPINLPLPQSDPAKLLRYLQERITKDLEKNPLTTVLEALSLEVEETAPLQKSQRDFFSRKEEDEESWSSLLARFLEKLGKDSTFRAIPQPRILPEASWKKSLHWQEGIPVPTPPRPLRLLDKPIPLEWKQSHLHGIFEHRKRSWKVLRHEGPEILSGEWWQEEFERHYFVVQTEEEVLWIFRSPKAGPQGLFLHGFFD